MRNISLKKRLIVFALLACLLPAIACTRSPATRFYILSPINLSSVPMTPSQPGIRVTVAAIGIPEYLDRTQIATRTGQNELTYSEYHRWAEPLAGSIRSTIAANLSVLMPEAQIGRYPSGDASSYRVSIAIQRFEREGAKKAVLSARWTIRSGEGVLKEKSSTLEKPAGNKSSESLAEALSDLLGDLSREIASEIRGAEEKETQ